MDHAETLLHLESSALAPGGLAALETDAGLEARAIRAHLASCEDCRAEYDALAATRALLAAGAPDELRAPAEARDRILRAVHESGVRRPLTGAPAGVPAAVGVPVAGLRDGGPVNGARPRGRLISLWPALAAAVVVLAVVGAWFGSGLVRQRDAAAAEARALTEVNAWTDRLLAAPDGRAIVLRNAAGEPSGSVLYSLASDRLVVFSQALDPAAPDDSYACYLERNGHRTRIGWMQAAGSVSYWMGSLPNDLGRRGDRFVVEGDGPGVNAELSGTF